ncbi:MAG: tetraacyldisaccharide 4'-kinase [Oligosphaeraceae bacterium]|nr:tetraacyldisaccharide 4'-kinase [Oligosphaeraceae bacterium]
MLIIRDSLEKLEQYVIEIINGERRHGFARIFRYFLFFLSRLYRNAVQFRLSLYNSSILRQRVLGCFVVSVGNLTTGGTGKTPLVELLARNLAERGKKVAILSRGYRSKPRPLWQRIKSLFSGNPELVPPRFVSDGERVLLDSARAGDEPYMLARNLLSRNGRPGVMVVVDKNRYKGGTFATRKGADIMILDDGFQHLKLRPWTNILVIDSTNPFHNHEMLPCGMLREPIKNLRRADYIFLTKSNGGDHLRHLRRFLKSHNSQAKIIECNHVPCYLEQVDDAEKTYALATLKGKRVAALSAIAVPESFEGYLEDLGAELVYRKRFVDHHRYRSAELVEFCRKAAENQAELLLTTEKDAVRLPQLPADIPPFLFLRVEIKILKGQEHFENCLSQICLGR